MNSLKKRDSLRLTLIDCLFLVLIGLLLWNPVKAEFYISGSLGVGDKDWNCPEVCLDSPLGFVEVGYEHQLSKRVHWFAEGEHVSSLREHEEGYGGNFLKTGFKLVF